MSRLVVVLILTFVAPGAGLKASQESNTKIHNGTLAPEAKNTVFALDVDGSGVLFGSGVNIRYPRCIVTASHAIPFSGIVRQDANALPTSKFQEVYDYAYTDLTGFWAYRDLAVLWLTGYETSQWTPRIEHEDYSPVDILPFFSGPALAKHWGYGYNTTVNGVDIGNGTLRTANINIIEYNHGPEISRSGGYYKSDNFSPHNACVGDSGGPLTPIEGLSAGVVGIVSTGSLGNCEDGTETNFSAFSDHAPVNGVKSNWEWVNDEIEVRCAKSLDIGVEGQGEVVASAIYPSQYKIVDDHFAMTNGSIDCIGHADPELPPGPDCVEYFHDSRGEGMDPQVMYLNATPAPGWYFEGWGNDSENCPCDAKSSTCTMKYEEMGNYGQGTSEDYSYCVATFDELDKKDSNK